MRIHHRFWQFPLGLALGLLLAQQSQAQGASAASEAAAASSSAQSSEKPLYESAQARDNDLLAKAYAAIAKPEEIVWLETPDEKIVSLYRPAETRKTKGALLMLHAPETPQLWPPNLENPRRHLPLYGWATMAVALPAKYPADIPARASASSTAGGDAAASASAAVSSAAAEPAASSASAATSSAEAAKPVVPRSQLITNRVDAAIKQLNKDGQFNLVVLADNSSAPEALAVLLQKINKSGGTADTIDGPLQALVLVNLQEHEPLSKVQLNGLFAVANLPVMDVFFGPENPAMVEARRLHKAEAMRQNLKEYQQLLLTPEQQVTLDDRRGYWMAKVQGFMEHAAKGSEVKGDKDAAK